MYGNAIDMLMLVCTYGRGTGDRPGALHSVNNCPGRWQDFWSSPGLRTGIPTLLRKLLPSIILQGDLILQKPAQLP